MARRITIEFLGDAGQLKREMGSIDGSTSKLGSKLKTFGKVAAVGFAAAGVAAVKFGGDVIGKASDLNETMNKTQVVFGKAAQGVIDWSKTSATSLGLSQQAALAFTSQFGDMFVQLGSTRKEAANTSQGILKLATDLGSFHNLETSDVLDKIAGAMRGEYDAIQKIIPGLSDARVKQQALNMSGKESVDALTEQDKALAALAIVQKDGAAAADDFAETSGGLANQQKILRAQFENVQASIGQKLLPVAVKLATWMNDTMIPAAQKLASWFGNNVVPAFEKVRAVFSKVLSGLRGDMGGNLGAIRSTIKDFVSIVTSLWGRFGGYLTKFTGSTFKNLKTVIGGALKVISGVFKVFASLLRGDWKGAWDGIKKIVSGALDIIKGVVRQALNIIKTLFRVGLSAAKGIVSGAWDGIKIVFNKGVDAVIRYLREMPDRIRDAFKGARTLLVGVGSAIIDGLKNGIEAAAYKVLAAVQSIVNKIPKKIRDLMGISSPSKVTTKLGEQIGEGLAVGLRKSETKAEEAAKRLLDKVKSQLGEIKGLFASLRDTVASSFTGNMFEAETATDFIDSLTATKGTLSKLSAAFRTLTKWGLKPAFLSQLFQSGNAGLILDLAKSKGQAVLAGKMSGSIQGMSKDLGASVASDVYGGDIRALERRVDNLSQRRDRESSAPRVQVTINGALDPVAVGRQVEQLLVKYVRSTGRPLQVRTV